MKLLAAFMMLLLTPQQQPVECRVLLPAISDSYSGGCRNGKAHGFGEATGIDHYVGFFRHGLPHGEGVYTWSNGDIFQGGWRRGLKHGKGEFTIAETDSTYRGVWHEGTYTGPPRERVIRDYEIHSQMNIERMRFIRRDGPSVVIIRFQPFGTHLPVREFHMFASSGLIYNYPAYHALQHVYFPFVGRITYMAPNRFGTRYFHCKLHFTLNKPGHWEIVINY